MFFNWKVKERMEISQAKLRPTQMPSKAKGKDLLKDLTIFVSMFNYYLCLDFQVVFIVVIFLAWSIVDSTLLVEQAYRILTQYLQ